MAKLERLLVRNAAVDASATVREAADVLLRSRLGAIAVLDEERCVVGVFTGDDLLRSLFPGYLDELRHTAFAQDGSFLRDRAGHESERSVREAMSDAEVVVLAGGVLHAAERFLHTEAGALPVVDDERFVGMLSLVDLCGLAFLELAR